VSSDSSICEWHEGLVSQQWKPSSEIGLPTNWIDLSNPITSKQQAFASSESSRVYSTTHLGISTTKANVGRTVQMVQLQASRTNQFHIYTSPINLVMQDAPRTKEAVVEA